MLGKPGHDPAGEQLVLGGRVDHHVAVARPDHGDVVDAARRCAGTGRRPRCRSGRASGTSGACRAAWRRSGSNWYLASPNSFGRGWPSSLFSSGLGSKVSRWLGPPAMNRKMTDARLGREMRRPGRQRVGRCPARSLLLVEERGQRQAAEAAEGVADELAARAGRAAVRERSRRISRDIEEPVQVEDGQGEFLQRLVAEERERRARRSSAVGGRPRARRKARSTSSPGSPPALSLEPAGEGRGQVVREPAVEQLQGLRGVRARLAPRRSWSAAPGRRTSPGTAAAGCAWRAGRSTAGRARPRRAATCHCEGL